MDDTTIGQYRVTGIIGRGGMGAVYAADHALLGRPAAIKVLLPELSQKQDIVMRFFNEARAATAIRHPGIIEIYDFGWTPEGAAFIVMERLDGETLGRRAARQRLRWSSALAIGRQIAGALSAAHAKGIVHRDLKPDNVFLVPDPEVPGGERIKLLDFGIAKLAVDSTSTVNVTKTGAVMGTPTYMAPEQCRGVAVDHRADLYALGCVLYELCAGRPPFVGEGSGDVLAAHIHVAVPPLSRRNPDVPPAVEQLIHRLLAKPPAERYQTAEELIRAIDGLAIERLDHTTGPRRAGPVATGPSLTTLSGSASTSMRLPGAVRRRLPLVAFSAGLAAITVVIVIAVMRGDDAPVAARAADAAASSAAAGASAGARSPSAGAPLSVGAPSAESASGGAPSPSAGAPRVESPSPSPSAGAPSPSTGAPSADSPSPSPSRPADDVSDREPRREQPPTVAGPRAPSRRAPDASPPRDRPVLPTTVEVAVDSAPPGAQVVLDGAVLGTTPFRGSVARRERDLKLIVRLAGYADRAVVARASQPIAERVTLVRKPAAPAAPASKSPKTDRDRSVNPF